VFRPLAVVASLVFAAGAALFLASGLARAATEASPPAPEGLAKATFAGGCFWCMEQPFEALPGVKSAVSGYTGGSKANPAYRQVSGGSTGHAEAVEVLYDPKVVGYERLLEVFWANIDPTVKDRQFCDVGPYAAKNPAQYKYYRWGCGRDARLKQVWGQAPAG